MIKVLIIEDNDDIRENVIEILELSGYAVMEANNGKLGVEMAIKHMPDIILCDIMMPELDGYGALEQLNKRPETSTIPFIFLTAKADRLDLRKGMELGADDYLTKPFDDTELLSAIETRLKKKDQQKQFYSKPLEQLSNLVSKKDGLAELERIIDDHNPKKIKKGQAIHHEGDRVTGISLIISGKVKTVKMAEDGRELITGIFEKDDFLDVNTLLSNDIYTDTAIAMEETILCLIPREQLDKLISLYPDIGVKFIKILANNIQEKEQRLLQFAYQSVRKRIAETIMRLLKQGGNGNNIKITRENLASISGTAPETVSRTLTDFKNEGLIEKQGSTLTVLNPDKLRRLKN
jgi:CheY-like chemotaxis protein